MILIADSGSTKTDWCLIGDNVIIGSYKTQGINPFHQSRDTIMDVVEKELMPMLDTKNIDALYFYGSSFAEMKQRIEPFIATYPLCQKSRIEQIA